PGDYTLPGNLPAWLANPDSVWLIAIFFVLFGLKNLGAYYLEKNQYRFNSRVAIRLSSERLRNYQSSDYRDFVNIDSSKHIRMICLQPFEFCQYIVTGIQQITTQTCLISIAVLAILLFNFKLFLLLLGILLPPVIVVFYFIKKRMTTARKNIQVHNQFSYQYVMDALKGYIESNVYNRRDFFLNRFIKARRKFSTALFDSMLVQSMPSRIIEVFAILGLFVLVVIAKWTGTNDSSYLLTIGAFVAAAYKIIPGIVKITNANGQMRAYDYATNSMIDAARIAVPENDNHPVVSIQSVKLKEIGFSYNGTPVLANLNLSLQRKDFLGISGASGVGKTTLLNIILGFLEPVKGEVIVNDVSLNKNSLKVYWPSIAYVRQQPFLIHDTLLRNITLEENGYHPANLDYAIRVSGLSEFISRYPDGLGMIITENGKNISGGQQQRIAIARALYKNADIILLDEPFNELDETSETSLLTHFQELTRHGKMVILITHNKKSLSWCNKIISLDES
ncbi:MAG TPA: ABC transporter ATP-binding protein, partial [Chitinophagaceae bacterium]|nr:ABC transporter ATP-binding protein [Chitinophagaceae bacterium]